MKAMTEGGTFKWIIINCVTAPTVNHLTSHYLCSSPPGGEEEMKTLSVVLSLHGIGVHMQKLSLITAGGRAVRAAASVCCGNEDGSEAKWKGSSEEEERKHRRSVWEGRSVLWASEKRKVMTRRKVQEIKNVSASEIEERFRASLAWKGRMSKIYHFTGHVFYPNAVYWG